MIKYEDRRCQECSEKIVGRSDKKFCSAQCRVNFNNRLTTDQHSVVRSINNILRKNWRILGILNPSGKTRISRDFLLQHGFNLEHFTSIYTTRGGQTYKYCYDRGYLAVDQEHFLLVVKKLS